VSDPSPTNNLAWRVRVLEREVERLKEGKPDVIAERVTNLSQEVHELRGEIAALRRLVMGAFVTIATGLTIAVVVQNSGAL
jgi:hypothetical protein